MPSLFARLRKYSPHSHENFLTEAFALTLEAVPTLAQQLAGRWTKRPPTVDPQIETQVYRPGVGIIDLELAFGRDLVVWVEIKKNAPQTGNQLQRYLQGIEQTNRHAARHKVMYLTRLGDDPQDERIGRASWAELGPELTQWLSDASEHQGHGRHMVLGFRDYLIEERMTTQSPLTERHIAIMETFPEAQASLDYIVQGTAGRLRELGWELREHTWARGDAEKSGEWPWQIWRVYERQPRGQFGACDFDWVLHNWDEPGPPRIGAGLIARPGERPGPDPLAAFSGPWLKQVLGLPFEDGSRFHDPFEHAGWWRVYRFLPLSGLADQRDLASQMDRLSNFVHATFAALRIIRSSLGTNLKSLDQPAGRRIPTSRCARLAALPSRHT